MFTSMKKVWGSVPDHVRYPGMIIGFLTLSVCSQVFLVRAALSDGGARIEEDYYQKALSWDEMQRRRAARDAKGWSVQVEPVGEELRVRVRDREGAPVELREGVMSYRRADHSKEDGRARLVASEVAGEYRASLGSRQGLGDGFWELTLELKQRGAAAGDEASAPWEIRLEVGEVK
jgi:nitrogen fixation protein FixH